MRMHESGAGRVGSCDSLVDVLLVGGRARKLAAVVRKPCCQCGAEGATARKPWLSERERKGDRGVYCGSCQRGEYTAHEALLAGRSGGTAQLLTTADEEFEGGSTTSEVVICEEGGEAGPGGALVPWHMDAHYWNLAPLKVVSVWLA